MKQEDEHIFPKGKTWDEQLQHFAETFMDQHRETMQLAASITYTRDQHPMYMFYAGAHYGVRELARLIMQGDVNLTLIQKD
jgi:hypothetical protein